MTGDEVSLRYSYTRLAVVATAGKNKKDRGGQMTMMDAACELIILT